MPSARTSPPPPTVWDRGGRGAVDLPDACRVHPREGPAFMTPFDDGISARRPPGESASRHRRRDPEVSAPVRPSHPAGVQREMQRNGPRPGPPSGGREQPRRSVAVFGRGRPNPAVELERARRSRRRRSARATGPSPAARSRRGSSRTSARGSRAPCPGSQLGACAAIAATTGSHASTSAERERRRRRAARPALWQSAQRTRDVGLAGRGELGPVASRSARRASSTTALDEQVHAGGRDPLRRREDDLHGLLVHGLPPRMSANPTQRSATG